ncbi:DUF3750 domain-containing protein [Salidesulfovibrio brasiliensis]|uniref:DUF3750 domain-containing protein n=1 Tax=Salidesulfovibrio brasiliensis TaxID=221711 RepID=UPI0006D1C3EC|nr:DUF3750 domain-containing protein [Salidesulfovibrio brasiliensis]
MKKILWSLLIVAALAGCSTGDWRTASREPAGIAPDPATTQEAVVQVYAAPAWGWRGWFAVHTWISAKRTGEDSYTVYEVVGWREKRGLPVVRIERDAPDRYWFGERPELLADQRGDGLDAIIDKIDAAAKDYPWADTYKAFPGPNSNTFTAWIINKVQELDVSLPFSAIGSGYAD